MTTKSKAPWRNFTKEATDATWAADPSPTEQFRSIGGRKWKTREELVKKCIQCKKHAPILHQPTLNLQLVKSSWPFARWGLAIVGVLPTAPAGFKHLITATDYSTKWVEVEPLVHTTTADVDRFIWKNIISRFGVPYATVLDNPIQFVAEAIIALCKEHNICFFNSIVAYPQGNG